jgi:hypothetical protein
MTNAQTLTDMQRWRDLGYSDSQIAAHFKTSRQAVRQKLGKRIDDNRKGPRIAATPSTKPPNPSATPADRALPHVLTEWRANYGLTQEQARTILHLATVGTYSRWERGERCSLSALVIDFIELWEKDKKRHLKN